MAIPGRCSKIFIIKADGNELDINSYVASDDLSQTAAYARTNIPAVEVSFPIGADTEFAKAIRRYLRRKWTIAWLEQFAAWAFGRN